MSALSKKQTFRIAMPCPLRPEADARVFIELRSCPPGLPVPEQAVAVPDVMELSEPGQVSERVFSTLPF
jgi:hypothetical protein